MRATGPRLRDLGVWSAGGTPPKDRSELWDGDVPWVSGKDFEDTRLGTPVDHITADAARSYSAVMPAGSIVALVRGMALVHGLPVALVHEDVAINQDVRGVVLRPEFEARFVHYALLATRWRLAAHVDRAAHGTARFVESGYAERLPDPRAVDQVAVADFLDRECQRLTTLIAHLGQLEDRLREDRRELFDRVAREVGARGRRLKFSLLSIQQGWSPECDFRLAPPGGWGVLKVGAVNYGTFEPAKHKALPQALAPRPELRVRRGDLLMSRANTRELVGSAAVVGGDAGWRLILCDKLYRLHLRPDQLDAEFAAYAINGSDVRRQIEHATSGASASMQNISQQIVRNLDLPTPSLSEQRRISVRVSRALERSETVIRKSRAFASRLTAYRDALITEAVTGKLDITRLSDAQLDESAHAALEGEKPEVLAS